MSAELWKMADGFAMVAEGIRALAALQEQEPKRMGKTEDTVEDKEVKAEKNQVQDTARGEKPVAVEDIRAVLAQKSQDGKSKEIKKLLGKYGVAKLSAVRSEDYPALLAEAKVL